MHADIIQKIKNLTRFVALFVKVNFLTGQRAGNISLDDPNLYCFYQNIDKGIEAHLIINENKINEYIEKYKNQEGIQIIEGIENIDNKILEIEPIKEHYEIVNQALFNASLIMYSNPEELKELFNTIKDDQELLKQLYNKGIKGIQKTIIKPRLLSDLLREIEKYFLGE